MEVKLYKSRKKALRLLMLTLPFVVIGIFMINEGDADKFRYFAGWSCLLFFGLGIPVSLFHFFDRRPQIIINELGIFDRTTHKTFINWEIIQDAYVVNIKGQKFICLFNDDKFSIIARVCRI